MFSMLLMSVSSSFSLFLATAVLDQTPLDQTPLDQTRTVQISTPHSAPQFIFLSLGDNLEEMVSLSVLAVLEVEQSGHCVCMLESL